MVGIFINMVIRKKERKNQIDIIELHNVVKFENGIYKIENKEFEFGNLIFVAKISKFEILKFELLNIKILKFWKLKCLNNENWNVWIMKIKDWNVWTMKTENWYV